MLTAYHLAEALPATFCGMLALWAAASNHHWFVRACVALAGLLVLVLIPAYQLILLFGAEMLVVVVGMSYWRHRRGRSATLYDTRVRFPKLPQVSLQTLLLLTVAAAVFMTIAISFPTLQWFEWPSRLGTGIVAGGIVLLCAWLVLGEARRTTRIVAALVLWPTLAVGMTMFQLAGWALFYRLQYSSSVSEYVRQSTTWEWAWARTLYSLPTLAIAMPVLCAWVYVMTRTGWIALIADSAAQPVAKPVGSRRSGLARWAAVSLTTAVASLPLYLFWRLMTPTPLSEPSGLLPSNYQHLIAAGRMIDRASADRLLHDNQLSDDELRSELERHTAAFDRMRLAFAKSATVDNYVEDDDTWSHLLFAARARMAFANRQQSLELQIETSLDWLKLIGLFDRLTMFSPDLGKPAVDTIWARRRELSDRQLYVALETLIEFDSSCESWDTISRRYDVWDENVGWESHLAVILADWTGYERYPHQKTEYLVARTKTRTLITELAILLYQQEMGSPPEVLDDLVPVYLPALPGDPFGDGPLQYRLDGHSYVLYSVGPDGKDNSDQPLSNDRSEGDLTIEELFPRPQTAGLSDVVGPSIDKMDAKTE